MRPCLAAFDEGSLEFEQRTSGEPPTEDRKGGAHQLLLQHMFVTAHLVTTSILPGDWIAALGPQSVFDICPRVPASWRIFQLLGSAGAARNPGLQAIGSWVRQV